jgi:hypothetical protein
MQSNMMFPVGLLGIFCVLGATLVGLSAMGSDLFATEDQWGLAVNMLLSGTITIAATILAPAIPERWGILAIIAVAVAIRVFALIEEPALSTDVYRYVWDGWVQAEGINPYRYIPIDPALSFPKHQSGGLRAYGLSADSRNVLLDYLVRRQKRTFFQNCASELRHFDPRNSVEPLKAIWTSHHLNRCVCMASSSRLGNCEWWSY